jgi:L-alanine-DL-glutamate epimerase-like enolase superfamily enzyme
MKITGVEAIPFRIPLKMVTKWATGSQDAAEHVLVRIHTDDGITGVAEAPPRPTIYGESVASIKFAIDKWFGPAIIGMEPFAIEKMWDKFHRFPVNNTAKGAIDIALHDIIGKTFGIPCYKLLGGWTNRIRMCWCVNLNPVREMVEEAQKMMGAYGFKTLKLKVGVEPDKDIEMVQTMRKELGDDVSIYVDANQGYDPFTAVRVLRKMTDCGVTMVEEPCPVADKKGRHIVAERLEIPLVGDESCFTPADVAREIELGSLRVVNIKTARTGFTLSRKIVDLCEQAGIRNLHGLQGDTGVGSVASAHFCAAFKNTSHYYSSEASFFLLLVDDFLRDPLIIKDGWLELSDKPGLGIEIDENKFKTFATK